LTALLGLVVATLAAYLLGADRTLIRNGLFGFNGILTGIALSVSLQWDWDVAVYIILGAIVSTLVMKGLAKLLIGWDVARLTAPFVLTAWLLLFAVYQFGQLHPTKLIGPMPVPWRRDPDRPARVLGRRRGGRVDGGQLRERLVPRGQRGVPLGQPLGRRGFRDRHPGQLAGLLRLRAARLGARRPDRAGARRRRGSPSTTGFSASTRS
jgi:hypothetical protein